MSSATISRRNFSKLVGVSAAYAAVAGSHAGRASTRVSPRAFSSAYVVRLSSNENPYGPSQAALKAMTDGFSLAWRYPDENADLLVYELARMNNVLVDQILLGDGSGEILKVAAAAFTNKDKKLVVANPTFEDIGRQLRCFALCEGGGES